ncbi:MAG: hypothetical protein HZC42_14095 [Candidatus Eisenbacteria bacterium]|nr:hypothetical protein [Candidatus Eisenbacteria bacterium]
MPRPDDCSAAFRALRRALLSRRLAAVGGLLRVELLAIGALTGAFIAWQARLPLDHLAHDAGPWAAVRALALLLGACALAGGVLAGARHRRRLAGGAPELPWLALPVAATALARHLAWESGLHALWTAVPAVALLAAALGLVPAWALALLAAGAAAALAGCARLGCALAWALAVRRLPEGPGEPLRRLLSAAMLRGRAARLPTPRWTGSTWRALLDKDLRLSWRPTPARGPAVTWLAITVLAAAVWLAPVERPLAGMLSAALVLAAAAALGDWLLALACCDPFAALRGLPLGPRAVWGARATWVAAGALATAALLALAARGLDSGARATFLVWCAGATLAVGLLAVHYGMTLFPRGAAARRLFGLMLGLALAASLMIPLFGWLVLLAALVHSARRLPRWWRLEEREC